MNTRLICACLSSIVLFSSSASAQSGNAAQDRANSAYECSSALFYAEGSGEKFQVESRAVFEEFERLVQSPGVDDGAVDQQMNRKWLAETKGQGRGSMHRHVVAIARECEEKYLELQQPIAVAEARKPGSYTADDLRYHIQQTGDYAAVADYIVHKYPSGKPLFDQIPQGELLGEFIAKIGAKGVREFSDAAVTGIVKQHYWQYNPPSSLIIEAEYSRRLKVKRYSQAQANRWAQQEQQARASRAQSGVYASPSIESARTTFQTCTTKTLSGYGGGTVVDCKTYK